MKPRVNIIHGPIGRGKTQRTHELIERAIYRISSEIGLINT